MWLSKDSLNSVKHQFFQSTNICWPFVTSPAGLGGVIVCMTGALRAVAGGAGGHGNRKFAGRYSYAAHMIPRPAAIETNPGIIHDLMIFSSSFIS